MIDHSEAASWFAMLFGDAPGLIAVCSTDNMVGARFQAGDFDAAAAYAGVLDAARPEGIYFRVTTLRPDGDYRGKRGGDADTCAVPCLWADVDIAGPGHKETNLPPDTAAALALVADSGLPRPSIVVHSGGGIYPFWRIEPAAVVDGDLAALSGVWQEALRMASARHGWHYGTGVKDLSRILRLPGTTNRKAGLERPCRVIEDAGLAYPLAELYRVAADIEAMMPEPAPARPAAVAVPARPGETTPGDAYTATAGWSDVLTPHGWTFAYARGPVEYWWRPGKTAGRISATINALGTDRLRVHSTSAEPFETVSYSKFGAYAALNHHGDHSAAAGALRRAGYGGPALPPPEVRANPDRGIMAGSTVVGQPAAVDPAAGTVVDEPERRYRAEVDFELRRQRVRRDALRQLDAEERAAKWREPPDCLTLAEELRLPDEPVRYRIDRLLPTGGNAVLIAQYKAGKTTMCNELIRSLADGSPFLGRFDVATLDGRIGVWNYEVGRATYRQWLRDQGIENPGRVSVLNLRGYSLPIADPETQKWIIRWLTDHDIRTWVMDPFARAFTGGGDENSNSDVGAFLNTLDEIKEQAGVTELVLPVHTGRAGQDAGAERARGATRLDDWADARWLLTVDESGRRYFRAAGRDVDVDEELLTYEAGNRRLTLGGWDRAAMKRRDLTAEVVEIVTATPGLGVNEIVAVSQHGRTRTVAALNDAVGRRLVLVVDTENRKRLHYPLGTQRIEEGTR